MFTVLIVVSRLMVLLSLLSKCTAKFESLVDLKTHLRVHDETSPSEVEVVVNGAALIV